MPVAWQCEALYNLRDKRKVAIRSGHGPGKSRFIAWAHWWVMICMKKPGHVLKTLCTGTSGDNLKDVLWSEIALIHTHMHPYFSNQFDVMTEHCRHIVERDAWFSTLRTARQENPDALQGLHGDPVFAIVDEAAGVHDKVFEIAKSSLSTDNVYAILTGNPTRLTGYFYDKFNKRYGAHIGDHKWALMHVDDRDELNTDLQTYTTIDPYGMPQEIEVYGRVSPGYVDEVVRDYGEESPQHYARVRGEFPPSEKAQVVRSAWVNRTDGSEKKNADRRKRIMGIDPADLGEDHGAWVIRRGLNIEEIDKWYHLTPTQQADRAKERYFDLKKMGQQIDIICVDCTGVGAGTHSRLKELLAGQPVRILRVMVQESPPTDAGTACNRLRDWLWWQCRLFFQQYRPWFAEPEGLFAELKAELTVPLYNTDNGKVKVDSKKELKKRNSRKSPNIADALCLTFVGDHKNPLNKDPDKPEDPHRKSRRRRRNSMANRWRTL